MEEGNLMLQCVSDLLFTSSKNSPKLYYTTRQEHFRSMLPSYLTTPYCRQQGNHITSHRECHQNVPRAPIDFTQADTEIFYADFSILNNLPPIQIYSLD